MTTTATKILQLRKLKSNLLPFNGKRIHETPFQQHTPDASMTVADAISWLDAEIARLEVLREQEVLQEVQPPTRNRVINRSSGGLGD